MRRTENPSHSENSRFAASQAAEAVLHDQQNRQAARVVAGRSIDAADCAEILAMLGLDAGEERAGR
jgi:hypothetical protein